MMKSFFSMVLVLAILVSLVGCGGSYPKPTTPTDNSQSMTTESSSTTSPTEDSSEPTESTEGTKPTEGTDPTDSTEPTEGSKPTDGSNPTEGNKPEGGSEPEDKPSTNEEVFVLVTKSLKMSAGDKGKITVTYTGNNKLTWTSNNTKVATVDKYGNVTAQGAGKTTIVVDNGTDKHTCQIDVTAQQQDYTLKLDKSTLSCKENGNSKKLNLIYDGPNKDSITWWSNDETVATVDSKGNVKPLKNGTAYIQVSDGVKTATCMVTVDKVTLKLSTNEISLQVGKTAKLTVSYDGDNPLTWDYNSKYVSVNNGVVTAKVEGTVYITVTDGFKQAQCKVIITASGGGTTKPTPKTLKINTKNYTEIVVGSTLQIDYTYDGDKSDLVWESDNTKYFTVNSNGLVTAKSVGCTGVFVTDGNLSAFVSLKVVEPKETVTYPATTELSRYDENAPLYDGVVKYAGDSMKFVVESLPKDSNPDTKVTSSNSSVVSVSCTQDGRKTRVTLSFKAAGSATVTVKSADGAKTLSYSITVKGDYACNPGSGTLTPEQFVNAYNGVIKANGMSTSGMPTGYLVLTVDSGSLTWYNARRWAESCFHDWWKIGYRTVVLTYEGTDSNGNYIFYERGSSAS